MSSENKNPIDKAIDAGKNIIKSAGKDYWIRSFTKYVSKYPKLKDIPGLEYLSKTNPKLAEYNTKDFKILFEGLVGAESSYRKTVNKKTSDFNNFTSFIFYFYFIFATNLYIGPLGENFSSYSVTIFGISVL